MTPEQQADYDYAMSQIKPRPVFKGIDFAVGAMPMIQISWDAARFQEAVKAGQEAIKKFQETMDAKFVAALGIPHRLYTAPNCRCTINPKGS